MKFGKVGKLCKSMQDIMIVNAERPNGEIVQWVGVGARALFPFYRMPVMNERTAFAIFDIDDKKKDDIAYNEVSADEIEWNMLEEDETEQPVEEMHIILMSGKSAYLPVDTTKGLRLINQAYLAPLMSKADVMTLHERLTESGDLYIVARVGLFVAAVIQPFSVTEDGAINMYKTLYERAKYSQECAKQAVIQLVDNETRELIDHEVGAQ